jgi:hypothetical protein
VVGNIQEVDVVRRVEVDLVEGEINRRSIKQSINQIQLSNFQKRRSRDEPHHPKCCKAVSLLNNS